MGRLDCKLPSTSPSTSCTGRRISLFASSDLDADGQWNFWLPISCAPPLGCGWRGAVLNAAGQNPEIPDNAICLALVTEAET